MAPLCSSSAHRGFADRETDLDGWCWPDSTGPRTRCDYRVHRWAPLQRYKSSCGTIQAPCLNEPGLHIVQVEGGSRLQITIAECSQNPSDTKQPGWVCQGQAWPHQNGLKGKNVCWEILYHWSHSPWGCLGGQPLQPAVTEPPVQRHWVETGTAVTWLQARHQDIRCRDAEGVLKSSYTAVTDDSGGRKQSYPGNI